jgi:hypothetical protein
VTSNPGQPHSRDTSKQHLVRISGKCQNRRDAQESAAPGAGPHRDQRTHRLHFAPTRRGFCGWTHRVADTNRRGDDATTHNFSSAGACAPGTAPEPRCDPASRAGWAGHPHRLVPGWSPPRGQPRSPSSHDFSINLWRPDGSLQPRCVGTHVRCLRSLGHLTAGPSRRVPATVRLGCGAPTVRCEER